MNILLDLSRLISCAERPAPTGIDRVEMAYAQRLLPKGSAAAMAPFGRLGLVDQALATRYVETLARVWQGDKDFRDLAVQLAGRIQASLFLRGELGLEKWSRALGGPAAYMLVSHHHLGQTASIARLLKRTGARFVCMVHDLIPVTYPEYARPGQPEVHARRMDTAARLADAIIVNSAATAAEFAPFLASAGRTPPVCVAPLGLDLLPVGKAEASAIAPYFICISTIEPRKNHLLLLNLWRELALRLGPATPKLILVGRRGWENENVIDMIERCAPIRGIVDEHNVLADPRLARLLAGASALLLPSFAEGYGLPIAEALAAGVPVICSDLPALREVGAGAPEYLDPLDGAAWRTAILDYARPDSPRRQAQLERLRAWSPPQWSTHFAAVERLLGTFHAPEDSTLGM